MPLIFDRGDKKYKAYVRNWTAHYKRLYCETRDNYNLRIDDYTCECNAIRVAKAKADEHFQVFSDAFRGGNIGNIIGAFISAIIGIGLAVFTGGASLVATIVSTTAAVTSAVTAIVGSIAMGVLNEHSKNAIRYYQNTTSNIGIATQIAKSQTSAKNPRVNALIYHPYEILAEGSIYKDGAPGSVSYIGIEAFNPMRGILGTKSINVLGEKINNRAHRHMAGNAYYDGLNLDMPKAQHNLYNPKNIEYLKIKIDSRIKQLEQGFKIPAENYFGAFDEGGNPLGRMYEEHSKADITPIVNHINTESFIIQNQYYREGKRLPLFEKMNPPGKVRIRSFYESKGLVHVSQWRQDYEFSRKYWYWYDYAIDQDGYIQYKKRNDESYNEGHKVGAKVLALLWYEQNREPPNISELAQRYLDKEKLNLSVDEEYSAQRAYEDYLIEYWHCFSVYLLDETTNLRPNDSAYRDWYYWKYEAIVGFDNKRQNYYDTIIQVQSWDQVFFNSIVEQNVSLNEVEIRKQNTFKAFIRAKLAEQENFYLACKHLSSLLEINPQDLLKKNAALFDQYPQAFQILPLLLAIRNPSEKKRRTI
ncbi:hypothetical protein [Helicobacter suis]|uniref:hypothetical protein n=3 Tax=Helicobacter suis TaxID=104628 RepID=UPI000934752E|nr:hypothetical protein [Helicobacter suis]BDR29036.1 hypothetical protein HSHS1_17970 [Helicobacter suis HS1]